MRLRHYLLLIFAIYQYAHCATTTEKVEIFTAEYVTNENDEVTVTELEHEESQEMPHKSITELVNEQTEAIKKIISEHKPPPHVHNMYPIITKQEDNIKIKEEKEKESIEELKKKCQHLSKLFGNEHEQPQIVPTTDKPKPTVQAFGPQIRPDFMRFKPKFPVPVPQIQTHSKPQQMAGNYFIFTQNPQMYGTRTNKYSDKLDTAASNVEEESISAPESEFETETEKLIDAETVPTPPTQLSTTEAVSKLKYVRLEPLVLRKTLLTNGNTVQHWYRVIPTTQSFIQIPDIPENDNVQTVAQPQIYDQNMNIPLPEQYQLYVDPQTGFITSNLPPTTSTTSTTENSVPMPRPQFFINPQTGMIYQSALPHQLIYHKRTQTATTQNVESPASTTTTTEAPNIPVPNYTVEITQLQQEEKPIEKKYKHEFRFVIPMVVSGTQDEVSNYPYQLDPYAYYPKNQRPETMNLAVPYVPNYQMIRKLAIPNILGHNYEQHKRRNN